MRLAALLPLLMAAAPCLAAEDPTRMGDVSTTFRLVGRNDRIAVDRYDDPRVGGSFDTNRRESSVWSLH